MPTLQQLYTELRDHLNDASDAKWTLARKKAFINRALEQWWRLGGYRVCTDESLATVANQVEYALPAAVPSAQAITAVAVEQGNGEPYAAPVWDALDNAGAVTLLLRERPSDAGKKIRIVYRAPFPALTDDADATDVPAEFIYLYAAYLAHRERAQRVDMEQRKFHTEERDAALRDLNAFLAAWLRVLQRAQAENMPGGW